MLCCAVLCCAVLCCAVLCCAVLCCAVLCSGCAVLWLCCALAVPCSGCAVLWLCCALAVLCSGCAVLLCPVLHLLVQSAVALRKGLDAFVLAVRQADSTLGVRMGYCPWRCVVHLHEVRSISITWYGSLHRRMVRPLAPYERRFRPQLGPIIPPPAAVMPGAPSRWWRSCRHVFGNWRPSWR
jgi:hypothetical protein